MFRREADIEGGRTIYGREYISALQNRNKSNLLETLGSAPLIVEELIPEDDESRYMRNQITKVIKGGGDWLGRMSGLSRIPGGLQQIAQQAQNRFVSRIEFELQSLFLPLQGFTREVLFEYESYTTQYRTGSAMGSFVGAAIGFYYLGPLGGWLGQVGGSFLGASLERGIEEIASSDNLWETFLDFMFSIATGGRSSEENFDDIIDPTGGLPPIIFTGPGPRLDPMGRLLNMGQTRPRRGRRRSIEDRTSMRLLI